MPLKVHPQLDPALQEASQIWLAGGWAMLAIAVVALIMFAVGLNVYMRLLARRFEQSWRSSLIAGVLVAAGYVVWAYLVRLKGVEAVTMQQWVNTAAVGLGIGAAVGVVRCGLSLLWVRGCTKWPRWVADPSKGAGPIGRILTFVSGAKDYHQSIARFEEVRASEVKPFLRDLLILRVCVAAAPLLGLLGTVTGMIATFDALTQGSGGEKTKGMVASGISEALITTETGLIVALAGLFLQYQLSRKQQRYKAVLAHMQTLCTQHIYRKNHPKQPGGAGTPRSAA